MAEFIEGDADSKHGYQREPASFEAKDYVLKHKHSDWYFIRLPNGDLVLAVYPQEDCYFATEQWRTI